MSLKKKIALSFLISSGIIALLAAFEYLSFMEIKKEIRYLEVTDTIGRKSLQLRRFEKNFFLYPEKADYEAAAVYGYLSELKKLLDENPRLDDNDKTALRKSIANYERRFRSIQESAQRLTDQLKKIKTGSARNPEFISLVESTFLEQPIQAARFLRNVFHLSSKHPLITGLQNLESEITDLRRTGAEEILVISKDLDKIARERTETVIRVSQIAILIIFPLFFIVGTLMLFFISTNVAKRLMLLINTVEKTGKGSYPHLTVSKSSGKAQDEVGLLIDKFNAMEDQLEKHDAELQRKNRELIQTRKLAAIGTLASGVAHELNNPLNNIYLSAQALEHEVGDTASPVLREAVSDIVGQTERVKRIVADLLEFARGREPEIGKVKMADVIKDAYKSIASSRNLGNVSFELAADVPRLVVAADQMQMEQVFSNLFLNAVDAMQGQGAITVKVRNADQAVHISVSDTGKGIRRESIDKIFEPFFTTKDKGTGLGLAIVYSIIKKHYGDISVQSEENNGTTFTITLPVEKM